MVGSSFPYSEWLPKPGQARGIQIDIKGAMLNIRYPMELGLVGDAKQTLKELVPMLNEKGGRSWREQLEAEIKEWWRLLEERAMQDADPINPQRLFWELNKYLPPDAIISSDSGSAANWYARDLKLGRGHMASLSGTLATMGPGVPYAIAAKFCHPHRPAVAPVGRPASCRARPQQPGSEPGDVGAACARRRSEESADADNPGGELRGVRRPDRFEGNPSRDT